MSDFKVPYTKIINVTPHPKADRLELAWVYGFQVVVKKDLYKVGDPVIFTPVDSVLPQWLEDRLFPADSKIKLNKHRIRQIRIRSWPSQGMLIAPSEIVDYVGPSVQPEDDLAELLGVIKFEPPTPTFQTQSGLKTRNKPFSNPHFRCFNGISNIKWGHTFKDEEVVIQCKLHGSHIRFGKAPFVPNTLWKKILKFLRLSPKFESVYGSNKVELTNRKNYTGFYGEDVYGACLAKFNAFNKIKDGEFVHGEIIGPGIQKGYTYGHTEHHLVVFDVRTMNEDGTQKWLNPEEAEAFAKERGFDFVPVLYTGLFSEEVVEAHTSGPSVYCPEEKIREGCVVKSRFKYDDSQNKRAWKSINPDYLDGDHGDNH